MRADIIFRCRKSLCEPCVCANEATSNEKSTEPNAHDHRLTQAH